ncbi:sigma-70 family RNA polymerase sigma factor [Kitasatospora sp. NPDC004614]|uniref:sigma-70 family RNA polymerase sigma factor n=1 Tax=unclassified Kitasatospora TaxID=2633591 RepID=UPI003691B12F
MHPYGLPGRIAGADRAAAGPAGPGEDKIAESSARTAGRPPLAAYTELYRSHHPGLLRYAGILTGGDHWRAEDLVAEAHLRVWRRLAAGQRIEDPRAYLTTTVRHLAAAPVRERAAPDVPGGESADPAAGVAETDRMRRLLARLPERWAHALWLAEVEGLSPREIGARLGVRRGAAAVLVHRAREGLRLAYLRDYPGSPCDPACAGHWETLAGHARGRAGRRAGQRVEHHLPHCADCRRRLTLLRRINLGLAGLVGSAMALLAALVAPPAGAAGQRGGEPACEVGYRITAQAGGGFQALLTVRNTTDRPVDDWTLRWPLADGEHLVAPRPGTGQAHEVAGAVLLDEGPALLPGASAEAGFTGVAAGPHSVPGAITVNGRPCRVKVW